MSDAAYGIVYKVTNLIDGKIYVGQTVQTLWRRRRAHENVVAQSTAYFHRALKKHGFENFLWEEVETCYSKEQLFAREIFWIEHFQCMAPAGYNSAEGGKGGAYLESHKQRIAEAMRNRIVSPQTRAKLSAIQRGKKLSETHIDVLRSKIGEKNHFFGRAHSEETRKRIGEKSKGRNWATGDKAGSWADADRSVILECYFQKMSNKDMIAAHLERTGRKIGIKALMRVFRELGLHISETRGRRGLIERHDFIESNKVEVFYERLRSLTLPDASESALCSRPTSSSMPPHPL
ncbi:hypothetical protein BLA6863_00133 [Burkholderia lata]|uniref:GIY-YIG domain-containing protein n=2 Tax=Burkholderia lata (strain ATCC 17760 / DSM 23089 / LMG 22485 / NCIMB 9086 / R18194 / 383) TaxID=482957 RepID=A0A6P2GQK1_BURL3|nr:hypothetical protein BLA6863_00133 [Burkholderia lata]